MTESALRRDAEGAVHRRILTPALLSETEPVVVIGTGPAGMRAAQELLSLAPQTPLRLFGDEPHAPYNRVQLSALLAGRIGTGELQITLRHGEDAAIEHHAGCRIVAVDRRARQVIDSAGRRYKFRRLVLATGSRPLLPPVPGMELDGVHTFRDLDDVAALSELRQPGRRVAVLGGGLLGLEAARGLAAPGVELTVIEGGPWLMPKQLDREAGQLLQREIEQLGVTVHVGTRAAELVGVRRVSQLRLAGGGAIDCDAVVVAAGVAPNTQLADESGLAVGRGILVNDRMQTSDPFIYAVGECAEHDGRLYGLAGPGLEQARVAAAAICGAPGRYAGSCEVTRLKLFDRPVFSAGRIAADALLAGDRVITYADPANGIHRRIAMSGGRLVGAQGVGDWPEASRVGDMVVRRGRVTPWQRRRFRRCGRLLPVEKRRVESWPETATVCNCTGTSRGRLSAAVSAGASDVAALTAATGAGSVCGSCRPLLGELVGKAVEDVVPGRRTLFTLSALAAAVVAAVLALHPMAAPQSVQGGFQLQTLWQDGLYKQISGFTLLGLTLLGLLVSARKRVSRFQWGDFASWRTFHAVSGVGCLAVLLAHTGLALGENLNRLLMLDFLALSGIGATTGLVFTLVRPLRRTPRRAVWWLHLLAAWPLPALLGYHILSVYYF